METGVHGETGLSVQRRVVEEQGHDIEHVIIRHLQMAVLLAKDGKMKLVPALQPSHAQVCVTVIDVSVCMYSLF